MAKRRLSRTLAIKPTRKSFNHFREIADLFPEATRAIVDETTEAIFEQAKANAPVGETHQLVATARIEYDVDERTGGGIVNRIDFPAMSEERRSAEPGAQFAAGKSAGRPRPYPLFQEIGTAEMPAQPFLVPAVRAHRRGFFNELEHLESRLGEPE